MKNIGNYELEAIYRKKYWDEIKGDKLAPGVSYVVFDGSVHSGVAQSVKWLQRALQAMGLYQGLIDGIYGQGTLLALGGVNDNDSLITRSCDEHNQYRTQSPASLAAAMNATRATSCVVRLSSAARQISCAARKRCRTSRATGLPAM